MNEIRIPCSANTVYDKQKLIGIIVDVSDYLFDMLCMTDLLISEKIKAVVIYDQQKHISIACQKGMENWKFKDNIELTLSKETLEIIQSMILDVFLHRGFPGYHYDFDVYSSMGEIQVDIIIQK